MSNKLDELRTEFDKCCELHELEVRLDEFGAEMAKLHVLDKKIKLLSDVDGLDKLVRCMRKRLRMH